MHVITLEAENLKRLKAVHIEPKGSVVKITGANGQGKTTVLDALWWAMAGTRNIQEMPIRKGEDSARVRVELGDLVVERIFKDGKSSVKVWDEGRQLRSPQKVLDELIGKLSFDPLEFTRMSQAQQIEMIKDLAGVGDEIDRLDGLIADQFENRTEVNREVKRLQSVLDSTARPDPDLVPDREVNVSELASQLSAAQEHNHRIELMRADNDSQIETLNKLRMRCTELEKKIKEDAAKIALPENDYIDTTVISEAIDNAESANRLFREKQQINETMEALEEAKADSDDLTQSIEKYRAKKVEVMAKSMLPVKDLTVTEDGVMLSGVPFEQASGAEQLLVSMRLAMAANPKVRVLRATDASLLDSQSLEIITKAAGDNNYQIWLEIVDESGEVGIVIEDGKVAAVND
jgi:DNA repair exonuclease SbcCD ATPase subunit